MASRIFWNSLIYVATLVLLDSSGFAQKEWHSPFDW